MKNFNKLPLIIQFIVCFISLMVLFLFIALFAKGSLDIWSLSIEARAAIGLFSAFFAVAILGITDIE
jgi:DMSO/TMAO reductase YedYZ heme-binding membrane subunit